jgi:hypothetical protein
MIIRNLASKLEAPRCFDFAQHRPPIGVTVRPSGVEAI